LFLSLSRLSVDSERVFRVRLVLERIPKNLGIFNESCSRQMEATILETDSMILVVVVSNWCDNTARGIAMAATTSSASPDATKADTVTSRKASSVRTVGSKALPSRRIVRYSPMTMEPSRNSRAKMVATARSKRVLGMMS
jgi:hypothetical protein